MVYLVVTPGDISLDLYSQRLAYYTHVPVIRSSMMKEVIEIDTTSFFHFMKRWWLLFNQGRKFNSTQDIFHLPSQHFGRLGYFLRKPFIITVHDLILYLDMKGYYNSPLIYRPNRQEKMWLSLDVKGIKKANIIIVPSIFIKTELMRHLKISDEKIRVIYHGVGEPFHPNPTAKRPCTDPYILYVGSEQPRKNLGTLFMAFKLLKEDSRFKTLKLVKIGKPHRTRFREHNIETVKALHIESDVIFKDWVSVDLLANFYAYAEIFAFPSIYEGFGWPPLEAMACGTPVVASNRASIPEILGQAAIYVDDSYNTKAWKDALYNILIEDKLKRRLSSLSIHRAGQFKWQDTAKKTLEVYAESAGLSFKE
jgi:glycosyltransferase involved in cell wall biosynthesis